MHSAAPERSHLKDQVLDSKLSMRLVHAQQGCLWMLTGLQLLIVLVMDWLLRSRDKTRRRDDFEQKLHRSWEYRYFKFTDQHYFHLKSDSWGRHSEKLMERSLDFSLDSFENELKTIILT